MSYSIGIIQDEYDTRDYLKVISDMVSERFESAKVNNPKGFMDEADMSLENWIVDAAIEIGGVQVPPRNGAEDDITFNFSRLR